MMVKFNKFHVKDILNFNIKRNMSCFINFIRLIVFYRLVYLQTAYRTGWRNCVYSGVLGSVSSRGRPKLAQKGSNMREYIK